MEKESHNTNTLRRKNKPRGRRSFTGVPLYSFCLVLFLGTLYLIQNPLLTLQMNSTLKSMEKIEQNIKDFKNIYHELPDTLSELKKFSLYRKTPIASFDSWGVRFSYLKLDNDQWVIRSFGPDQDANTFEQGDDLVLNSLKQKPSFGVTYHFSKKPHAYPFSVNMGAFSPDQKWFARIFVDPYRKVKQLFVINIKKPSMIFVAPHDSVTSFYWLGNSEEIIFSGAGGTKYNDGLFVWNLKRRSLRNVLSQIGTTHPVRLSNGNTWFIYLAGVQREPTKAFVFLQARESKPLDLIKFFSKENFWEVSISKENQTLDRNPLISTSKSRSKSPSITINNRTDVNEKDLRSLHASSVETKGLTECRRGTDDQKNICSLPKDLAAAEKLEILQEKTESLIDTPAFPYMLWHLIETYAEAAGNDDLSETESRTLISYSLELARLLTQHYSAPPWLQHAAWNYWLEGVDPNKYPSHSTEEKQNQ